MIINRIHINEFGGLRGLDFELSGGLNVITGDNESGKSTLMNFIRFLLYGLPAQRGSDNLSERERALSWESGNASGFMEISDGDAEYRIERSCTAGGSERKLIVSLSSGAAVYPGKDAGEVFTGVSKEVFDSVCSVKQLGVGDLDGRAVGQAIENIMLAGDESVNTGTALRRLDKARRELMALKGQGGRINDLRRREENLTDRLREARSGTESILSLQATSDKYRALTADLRKKLDAADDRCHAADTVRILKDFSVLKETREKLKQLESEDAVIAEEFGAGGALPDGEYAVKLDSLSRRLGLAESGLAVAKARHSEVKSRENGDPALAARYPDICAAGGTAGITAEYRRKRSAAGRTAALAVLFALLGLCLLAVSLYFFFTSAEAPSWFTRNLQFICAVAGFVLAVAGAALVPSAVRKKKSAASYLASFGYDGDASGVKAEEEFASHAAKCAGEEVKCSSWRRLCEESERELREKQNELYDARLDARTELGRYFETPQEDSALPAALVKAADRSSKAAAGHARNAVAAAQLRETVERLELELREYDETSLRAHLMPEAEEKLERIGPQRLAQERDALAAQLEAATQRLTDSEKNLAVLSHTVENPARLNSELESVTAEREEAEKRCEAIILAQRTIEGAGDSLRRNMTPRLRARAGELLSLITSGRYTDLGLGDDFSVFVATDSGTRDISVMSGGTRDAAYFALRVSLLEIIFPSSRPPMLLDEVCSQLDDSRTSELLRMLGVLSGCGLQCILFSCQSREERMLTEAGTAHTGIRMTAPESR